MTNEDYCTYYIEELETIIKVLRGATLLPAPLTLQYLEDCFQKINHSLIQDMENER